MHSFDSRENDKEKEEDRVKRLPGWEREKANDDLLDPEAKRKLESYKVTKEKGE
jgi:hypothetical protein